jgi:hypothetical protein
MTAAEVDRVRVGRNWLRVGDRVHVTPRRPRGREGFDAPVTRLLRYPDGRVEVEVWGAPDGKAAALRTFRLERIRRRVQTRRRQPVAEPGRR